MPDSFPDFGALLTAAAASYRGPRERAVRRAGELFHFYSRLFSDPELPRHARATIASVIAYFVVSDDVLPEEEMGPIGLVDDVYVAAYAFRQLARDVPHTDLIAAWQGEGDLDEVMADVYRESRAELGKRAKDVLRMAGLQ